MFGVKFSLLGLEFNTFSFFIYLAFLSAGGFFYWYSERITFGFWGFLCVFLIVAIFAPTGAEALSALEFHHPLSGVWHQDVGSTHLGGYILAIPIVLFAVKLLRANVLRVMDGVALAWIIGYAVGRFACFFSGDGCYGLPTSSIFGMTFPHGIVPTLVPVWPTPLFESGYSIAIFIAFSFPHIRKRITEGIPGRIFFGASALMFLSRFAVEFIRRNPRYDGLSLSQWLCVPLILIYVSLFIWVSRKNLKATTGKPNVVAANFSVIS